MFLAVNYARPSRQILLGHSFLSATKQHLWNKSILFLSINNYISQWKRDTEQSSGVVVVQIPFMLLVYCVLGRSDCAANLSPARKTAFKPHFQPCDLPWPDSLRTTPGQYCAQSCFRLWPTSLKNGPCKHQEQIKQKGWSGRLGGNEKKEEINWWGGGERGRHFDCGTVEPLIRDPPQKKKKDSIYASFWV